MAEQPVLFTLKKVDCKNGSKSIVTQHKLSTKRRYAVRDETNLHICADCMSWGNTGYGIQCKDKVCSTARHFFTYRPTNASVSREDSLELSVSQGDDDEVEETIIGSLGELEGQNTLKRSLSSSTGIELEFEKSKDDNTCYRIKKVKFAIVATLDEKEEQLDLAHKELEEKESLIALAEERMEKLSNDLQSMRASRASLKRKIDDMIESISRNVK